MRKLFKLMLDVVLFIWQLPQNIVGLFAVAIFGKRYDPGRDYWTWNKTSAVSLAKFILANERVNDITLRHEKGHRVQSLLLGPLYLIVIGIPSITWAALHDTICPEKSYYWFYTERWADKLAGINRG